MRDGKLSTKRDIVILSVKPKRPEFPLDKKYVLAKTALQEWDKLDAYFRGQILKLKSLSISKPSSSASPRKSIKSSSSSKKSSSSRRSTSDSQLTELFGDENIPLDADSEDISDTEITLVKKSSHKRDRSKSKTKSKKAATNKPEVKEDVVDEDDNYLSVPRDNFIINFAINQKKRTPLHRPETCKSPNYLSPIKVEPYKPPAIALGFNGVHIQKILYHKTDGLTHTSPTTTSVPTPDKPPDTGSSSSSPSLSICSGSSNDSKLDNVFDETPLHNNNNNNNGTLDNKTLTDRLLLSTTGNNKHINTNSKISHGSNNHISTSNKRKHAHTDNNNASSPKNGGSVSSTTNSIAEDFYETRTKKSFNPSEIKKDNNNNKKSSQQFNTDKLMGPPLSLPPKSLSITDSIIKKAKQGYKSPEIKERELRRRLECEKRKAYAMEKVDEQEVMELVDVSMKALEMVTTYPLLSPIRSP